ncbi:MAG: GNAT family N-acetyltransferase [Brevundimonas sp.]|uniref:GNAT family N-acetyltransferase n=1 Tax=Brevundimonas sp. TaxID=1871086 RepID=UPI00391B647A
MSLALQVHVGIDTVGRDAWNALAGPTGDPFVRYEFLHACEASRSAVRHTGWTAQHLTLSDGNGRLLGAMPLYLKWHSQGEYVFDQAWADAYMRAGGRYYPKLLSAVPFTPVTGPRLLVAPGGDGQLVRSALIQGALQLAGSLHVSSLHVTFPTETDWQALGAHDLLLRQDQQFHWENRGYGSFDDFLAALSSSRRKTIRRERREAQTGLDVRVLSGSDLTEAVWDSFFAFYMDTGDRKWGRPYLTRPFFSQIGETMAERIALMMAYRDGRPIAGALNLIGDEALYGRQWGCIEDVPFLHFELCYYQAIDFAIARGLKRVEAGAQGEHKIARGYLPTRVRSAHWIADPALRSPVARYLGQERPAVEAEMAALAAEYSPYRS